MIDQIKHNSRFMDPEDARLIAEYAAAIDANFTEYGNGEKEFTFFASFNNPEVLRLLNFYGNLAMSFVKNNYEGPFEPYDESKTHVARFIEGFGMHEHYDVNRPNDIATLIYLNDNYEGGEIYFPAYDVCIKPQAGDLVCFPDNEKFVHGVKPILSGTRYTSPRWFTRIV
jgi:hypothetical protein